MLEERERELMHSVIRNPYISLLSAEYSFSKLASIFSSSKINQNVKTLGIQTNTSNVEPVDVGDPELLFSLNT